MKVEERVRWRVQEEPLILYDSDQVVENRVWASMGLVVVIWCYPWHIPPVPTNVSVGKTNM
jgi:hypothetical protein